MTLTTRRHVPSMRSTFLIVVALASVIPCWAGLPEEFQTSAGEWSGYYWRSLSQDDKLEFVIGFHSGYLYARPSNRPAMEQSRKSCLAQFANPTTQQTADCLGKSLDAKSEEYRHWDALDPLPGGTYGETVEATDRFFAEPENRVMPVTAAWVIAKWKREGRQQGEIDNLMDGFRESYIRAPRALCEKGIFITASRCRILGATLKPVSPK